MAFPVALILLVLGSIYLGIATPVEASAVGAFGALLCAIAHRKFNWKLFKNAALLNLRLTAMIFWIYVAAICFSNLYTVMGARDMVEEIVVGLALPPMLIIGFMQFSIIIMGMLMDDYAIILITCPIYVPIVAALGLDTLWFGILFVVNMQIAYVTPPYGFNLFYMRGVTVQLKGLIPEDITMTDIWRSVLPYIPLQLFVLVLVMVFPQLATWLPSTMTVRR
ncbi:C4-dicarboxylate TRAP transporter large permease protein DctM [subsurface metagenome]